MKRYDFGKIETKWQRKWQAEKVYEPSLKAAKKPFYNLMMFPYPSAEGLHVGNMYAFTGADIYGRFKRMQGYDVFEPIGLDGFGIHSENYALKIGTHPAKQSKISEKRFYKQLASIGNGFAWDERLETYDPEYYRWTQWIFAEMFKKGLAYRKKQPVNWCPSCKTVLADEQVVNGKCERCGMMVIKKDLEQWFFRITKYADRLLGDLKNLDWSERVKIAQENWIGKSEGTEIEFRIKNNELGIKKFVLLHGFTGSSKANFFPWLKDGLTKKGFEVYVPDLPNTKKPTEEEQVNFVLKNAKLDEETVILGHSLGAVVAMKVIERLNNKIGGFVSVGGFASPKFLDHDRIFSKVFKWDFDFEKIKAKTGFVKILSAKNDYVVPVEQGRFLAKRLGGVLVETIANEEHFCAKEEPEILDALAPSIKVFTTRPDTLFGATFVAVSPEVAKKWLDVGWQAKLEVKQYIEKELKNRGGFDDTRDHPSRKASDGRDKTGVYSGVDAANPANGETIPVWVVNYVLGDVGTGAIMAVPGHDERDFEFAKKYKLPMKMVVCPHFPAKTCPVLDKAYVEKGHMVDSGKFDGMDSEKAKWEITKFVGGKRRVQYRLRDWLISRQRYWGPPIPMIYCEVCAKAGKGEQKEMLGWYAVPEKDLPVKLPIVKDFRPKGTGESPLALAKSFYEVKCSKCKSKARRETDVSDTFLDSAWYYLGYLMQGQKLKGRSQKKLNSKVKSPWNRDLVKKWLPINLYTGGAEHSVLHLLYVRFLAKVFHDWGLVSFDEPAKKFRAHGLLIKEGAKMSKSKGNVVNPDFYIKKFGADTLRMYLMFLAPFEQGGDFRDSGILGIERFLNRIWSLNQRKFSVGEEDGLWRQTHKTIKKVTEDIESLSYNTAISAMMILLNEAEKQPGLSKKFWEVFLKLLAPFAPHMTEEIWREVLGNKESIHISDWPKYDPKLIKDEKFTLVIQINGKVRDSFEVEAGILQAEAEKLVLVREKVQAHLRGAKPKKVIFVPGRLINLVI